MAHSLAMGWFVLSKYYGLSDASPAYAAAILLHPMKRARYIQTHWIEEWRQPAIDATQQLWISDYKSRSMEPFEPVLHSAASLREPTALEKLRAELSVVSDYDSSGDDDFNRFINDPPIRIDGSPLKWWCDEVQRRRYPRLSRMAMDILSIPPMSDEVERVFSGARRTISWGRARLGPQMIQAVECVGSWLRGGLIRSMGLGASIDRESVAESVVLDSIESVNSSESVFEL